MNPNITIDVMSVKVMRSHDYCHFEVQLSSSKVADGGFSPADVDDLRKEAARLADKAVEQYKIMKLAASRVIFETPEQIDSKKEAHRIREIVDTDRSITEKAFLKAHDDAVFHASRDYDYQDVWQNDDY